MNRSIVAWAIVLPLVYVGMSALFRVVDPPWNVVIGLACVGVAGLVWWWRTRSRPTAERDVRASDEARPRR